jgi:hypothetical protein
LNSIGWWDAFGVENWQKKTPIFWVNFRLNGMRRGLSLWKDEESETRVFKKRKVE